MLNNKVLRALFAVAKFNAQKDYYKTLGVNSGASKGEIKKAFLQMAKKYHPDSNQGKEELFKEVNEAYQVLSSEDLKKQYDTARNYGSQGGSPYGNGGSYQQSYYSESPKNTYRGYQRQQGWGNSNYRDQILHEIFKAQEQQRYNRQRGNYSSFSGMYKENPYIKKYGNSGSAEQFHRARQEAIKRALEEEARRRQKEFQQFKDKQDVVEELRKKMDSMREGFTNNIKGFEKAGEFLKDVWNELTKKK